MTADDPQPDQPSAAPSPIPFCPGWGESDFKATLMLCTLEVAFPMWVERVRDMTRDDRTARAKELSRVIAEKGDILLFSGGQSGDTAAVFNALAESVAILSFAPGGVLFLNRRWETKERPVDDAADAAAREPIP